MINRFLRRLGVPVLTPGEPHLPLSRRMHIVLPWSAPAVVVGLSGTAWMAATRDGRPPSWYLYALIPSWLALVVGVCRLAREERRHQRRAKGVCVRCGYDLRGNVSGVCPECGMVNTS